MFNLGFKIVRELKIIGLSLDGTDPPNSFFFSFDVYYNRRRDPREPASDSSGRFHRDMSSGLGNDTDYVSLEYFIEDDDVVILGPEVLEKPYDSNNRENNSSFTVRGMYLQGSTSSRILAKNGSTILFDNKALIHATPITHPIPETIFGVTSLTNAFQGSQRRIELVNPEHEVVVNTETGNRSFVRCWIASANNHQEAIPNMIGLQYARGTLQAINASIAPFNGSEVTHEDIFGGSLNIENYTVANMKTSSFLKPEIKPLVKPEIKPKDMVSEKLFDFKIVGDPSNPPIELNLDVPFEEITGKSNINNYKLKEMAFIKAIVNKKGGKNRKYKKRYINKTKKARKTKKVRKQYKNAKTKKVKRVKKTHKYSKKNYKY